MTDTASPTPTDWWTDRSLHPLREHFRAAQEQVRIATGFFSLSGYNLAKRDLEHVRVRAMVGYDERAGHELGRGLLQEMLDDLSHWHENRREAVQHMVRKLQDDSLLLDLALGAPDQAVQGLYLVAPDAREKEVRAQLSRPAFQQAARLHVCYLPYGELERHREVIARFGTGLKAIESLARRLG